MTREFSHLVPATPPVPRPQRPTAPPTKLIAWFALIAIGVLVSHAHAQPSAAYRIIVHPGNSASSVERIFLAHVFLKKVTTWDDGENIHPVDLPGNSPVRRRFSEDILERPVSAVRNYWQQLIFSGRGVPPPELDNDDAVVRYVVRHPGAIGYVSGTTDVHAAKVLLVR